MLLGEGVGEVRWNDDCSGGPRTDSSTKPRWEQIEMIPPPPTPNQQRRNDDKDLLHVEISRLLTLALTGKFHVLSAVRKLVLVSRFVAEQWIFTSFIKNSQRTAQCCSWETVIGFYSQAGPVRGSLLGPWALVSKLKWDSELPRRNFKMQILIPQSTLEIWSWSLYLK